MTKRKKVLFSILAVFTALVSTFAVTSVFAMEVLPGGNSSYYIIVGTRETDISKVYYDNSTNTIMWVFDKETVKSLAIFNDYNYVASGMNGTLQTSNLSLPNNDSSRSFLIGCFYDVTGLPTVSGAYDFVANDWQSKIYLNNEFNTVNSLAYSSLSTTYALTELPHMQASTNYWRLAEVSNYLQPVLIWHNLYFDELSFEDYSVIGAQVQPISMVEEESYQNGFQTGYNSGYNTGVNDGKTAQGELNQTEKDEIYLDGVNAGKEDYIENYLPYEKNQSYQQGVVDGVSDYINNTLPGIKESQYQDGYYAGKAEVNNSFDSLLTAVFDVPIKTITGLLDFNLLGTNIKNLVLSFLSLAVIITIVRWLI